MPLFLLVFTLISAIGIFTAYSLPAIYRAQTRILVESAQIPDDLAASTVQMPAQEQLQIFETRLLARDNLLAIAAKITPFAQQDAMSPDQIVEAMRKSTSITRSTGQGQATLMTISFESQEATKAAAVLGDYLTFILQQDVALRSSRAGQTEEFFQQEVDRLSANLSASAAKILEFKLANVDALPESLDFHRDLQIDLQDRMSQIDADLATLEEQGRALTQVYEATGRTQQTQTATTPEEQRLQQMRNDLSQLEAIYNDTNPRVVLLRNQIAQQEAAILNQTPTDDTSPEDPSKVMYDLQMAEINTRVSQLQETRATTDAQLAEVIEQIRQTPANAIALEALERDHANIQSQYDRAVDSLARAATGERIESLSRGQRVSVVEQPSVPTEPVKPNRKMLAALGIMAGGGTGAALIFLLEMMSGTIKRSSDLVGALGFTPLATIPYMRTKREIRRTRVRRAALSLAIGVAIPVAIWAIHTYYMPFDLIIKKVAAKLGLYI